MSIPVSEIIIWIEQYGDAISGKLPRLNRSKLIQSLKSLDEMIGMQDTKTAIVDQLCFLLDNEGNTEEHLLHTILRGPPGTGKCLGKGTNVLTYPHYESKRVEDITCDDLLVGDDHTPRKVLGICSGIGPLYKIYQSDGVDYLVNYNHILCLVDTKLDQVVDLPLSEYILLTKRDQLYGFSSPTATGNKKLTEISASLFCESGEYYGFELDGNGRFLLGDYTVTHNTSLALVLADIWDSLGILRASDNNTANNTSTGGTNNIISAHSILNNILNGSNIGHIVTGPNYGTVSLRDATTTTTKSNTITTTLIPPPPLESDDGGGGGGKRNNNNNSNKIVSLGGNSPEQIIKNFCQVLNHTMNHKEDVCASLRRSTQVIQHMQESLTRVKKILSRTPSNATRNTKRSRKEFEGMNQVVSSIDLRKDVLPIFDSGRRTLSAPKRKEESRQDENNSDSMDTSEEEEHVLDDNRLSKKSKRDHDGIVYKRVEMINQLNDVFNRSRYLFNILDENINILSGTIVAEKERTKHLISWSDSYTDDLPILIPGVLRPILPKPPKHIAAGEIVNKSNSLPNPTSSNSGGGGEKPPAEEPKAPVPANNPKDQPFSSREIHTSTPSNASNINIPNKQQASQPPLEALPKTKVRVTSRIDYVAEYLGQSAIKTKKLLDSMEGGVVIIEEAYSLYNGDKDSFGLEAINFINQWMSEKPTSIIFIFLGYKDSLEQSIFYANKGLKRRFGWSFDIPEYSGLELSKILRKQLLTSKYRLARDADDYLLEFIQKNMSSFINFGGDTFRFIFHCKLVHARHNWRMGIGKKQPEQIGQPEEIINTTDNSESMKMLTKSFLEEALVEFKKHSMNHDHNNSIMQTMYL